MSCSSEGWNLQPGGSWNGVVCELFWSPINGRFSEIPSRVSKKRGLGRVVLNTFYRPPRNVHAKFLRLCVMGYYSRVCSPLNVARYHVPSRNPNTYKNVRIRPSGFGLVGWWFIRRLCAPNVENFWMLPSWPFLIGHLTSKTLTVIPILIRVWPGQVLPPYFEPLDSDHLCHSSRWMCLETPNFL